SKRDWSSDVCSSDLQLTGAVGANRQIVAIQPTAERLRARRDGRLLDRPATEHLALGEEDIEVSVIVVIEQRDAAAHHLREIEIRSEERRVGKVSRDE